MVTMAYPYKRFFLVRLTDNEFGTLNSAARWVLGTVTDTDIPFTTPASTTITGNDIKAHIKKFTTSQAPSAVDITSLADDTDTYENGRRMWEANLTCYLVDAVTGTKDFVHNPVGKFLLYAERPDESIVLGVVVINNDVEVTEDSSGAETFDLTLKNASRRSPIHE